MKLINRIRFGFQIGTILCFFMVLGAIGSLETGRTNFLQMILQVILFAGMGAFFAHMSKKRFFIRLPHKRPRRPAASAHTYPARAGYTP